MMKCGGSGNTSNRNRLKPRLRAAIEPASRAKAALSAAKARGVKLGGPKLAEAREVAVTAIKLQADRHAANVLPIIRDVQRSGAKTLRDVAAALNARGISTSRGGRLHAMTVRNVLARA
jgi:DNA invertase Pin-like site-specific DNA recombinase